MREHIGLYRGKRKDNGEWVQGAYCKHDTVKICLTTDDPKPKHFIIQDGFCDWGFEPPLNAYEVDPDTVGECTGLTDKNGKLIFEGDIVRFRTRMSVFKPLYVRWHAETARFLVSTRDGIRFYPMDKTWEYEIIGNIHDAPELLGGGDNG